MCKWSRVFEAFKHHNKMNNSPRLTGNYAPKDEQTPDGKTKKKAPTRTIMLKGRLGGRKAKTMMLLSPCESDITNRKRGVSKKYK